MSGNSTRLAVAAAGRSADAVRASGLIGLFVLGVAAGGGLPVGLTYMTGTLVKMGQQIGSITSRNEMWQWWPYAAHWLALLVGALGGAAAFKLWSSAALWPAVTAAGLLALMTRRSTPDLIP
jgi:uncharacterized membrane protein YoaK (UPF0700 family)